MDETRNPIPLEVRADIAQFLFACGRKPGVSTAIDDDTLTQGYGHLDEYGFWEYPLPHLGLWSEMRERPEVRR